MTLRERCLEFYKASGRPLRLREGELVQAIYDFVLSEIGRSADEKLTDAHPLVMYFTTKSDREEFMEAILAENPNMISRRWPPMTAQPFDAKES